MTLTAQERIYRTITEREWQQKVQDIASLRRWRWFHAPDNQPTARGYVQNIKAGFPDLVLVRKERLIFAELKRETGKTSTEQEQWLEGLSAVLGVETYVWRPSDIDSVMEVLA